MSHVYQAAAMMDAPEQQPPVSEPLRSTPVPIAQLSPTLENLSNSSVHAVVTLLWPYSSSTRSLGLLLAEPDFRLRRTNGQVKVVFHGSVAEEVAKSQVGIGDSVYIGLAGSRFVENDTTKQTPGRFVAWDVHFDSGVFIEIWRSSQHLSTVKVDRPLSPLPAADDATAPPATPTVNSHAALDSRNPNGGLQSWQSPAFIERSRPSLGHLSSSLFDPFAEEDGFVLGKGRKRPRFSMRGSDWRLVDEPASPGDTDIPGDWTAMFDDEAWLRSESGGDDMADEARQSPEPSETRDAVSIPGGSPDGAQAADVTTEQVTVTLEPSAGKQLDEVKSDARFLLPQSISRTESPGQKRNNVPHFAGHLPIDTPRLHPIPSPGLPVPSPLVSTSNSPLGYFGSVSATPPPQSTPPTTANQEVTGLASEDVSDKQPDLAVGQTDEGVATTVNSEPIALSQPGPQEHGIDSQPEIAHPVSVHETVAAEKQGPEDVEVRAEQVEETVTERAASDVAEPVRDENKVGEGAKPGEIEIADIEEDEEMLEAEESPRQRGGIHISQEKGIHHRVNGTRDENYESESASHSSVIESSRPGDMSEDEDATEEDVEPRSKSRYDIELVSDSEAESPAKPHDTVRRAHEYHIEGEDEDEDEDEEMEDEEDISDEDGSDSEESEGAYDEDGYDDRVDSESEFESESDEMESRAQQPIRTVEPEVIVLDSDSDDEPPPSIQRRPFAAQEPVRSRSDLSPSADEASSYGTSESGDDDEVEMEGEEDDDDAEGYSSGAEGEEWSVEDDQEADEREVETVDVESIYQIESERDEEWHSDRVQAHERIADAQSDGAVSEKHLEPEQTSARDLDDEQPDDEDADADEMEVGSARDEHMHDEQKDQEQVEEKVDNTQIEVEHIEGEAAADHGLEDAEAQSLVETDRDVAPGTSPGGERPSIAIDEQPGFHVGDEESRTAEVVTQELIHEEIRYISDDAHIVQQADASTEPILRFSEPPIDPELLNAGTFSSEDQTSMSRQHSADTSQAQTQETEISGVPEQAQHIDPSLSLGGTSQSLSLPISAAVTSDMPILPLDQLVTPEPSQIIGVDKDVPSVLPVDEAPPTPEPTQEILAVQQETETPPTIEPVVNTTATAEVDNLPQDEDSDSESGSVSTALEEQEYVSEEDDKGVQTTHSEDEVLLVGDDRARLVNLNRNFPGLRSKHSYFSPLATLIDHFNALTDTISVVSEVRPAIRATSGKKDYILTFGLTDPSLAGTILYAQIFRPYKTALPSLEEGDAILLRNFTVKSFKHSMTLASVNTSAWAVFTASQPDAHIDGPPVEYGPEEQSYATDLRQWYQEDGMAMVADYQLQASIEQESREATPAAFSDSGSVNSIGVDSRADSSFSSRGSRRRKSHRRITIHELRDGRRYAEVGSPTSKESIHELRDGTVYANF
ncbi:hypothetical protein BO94DRAFT_517539 [Aspergillus sclerotioniger CBS 115572]|uniref:Telomeric single stranded DNA binding POT1/Cdc13 domain-containing protein n=1 Tax=Aspergillus sclerotioniger CBS 115572 TaxID=1450535 RepID=A0A317WN67_9EURO|nr:hypothetical protein BO94DRAFT_517539 [Aspergillus sclerotioniger CBS 115572]PWY86438.1 hypothetical protein BO94DRAFT_517539 [Aspergillus sclerotioniger CBS 115572]